jgi:methionyl aminopeptidase
MITIKTEQDIEKLREGGKRLAFILSETSKHIAPDVSIDTLNDIAHKMMIEKGDKPAFLNYRPYGADRPFPAAMCICINDEIVHGIPNENPKTLKEGDIVTLDAGLIHEGLFTDHAITYKVGEVNKEVKKLLDATREALASGIKMARAGNRIGDISSAIAARAQKSGFKVVKGLAGHSVGYSVHEDPYVPNEGRAGTGELLKPGMVLAIEPMFSMGSANIKLDKDGYTYKTADGSLSAQFEHTVLITEGEPEILTKI